MLSSVFLFFSFSGSEIMLILFVALILFGGDKFPEIARGLGKGIREFKDMSDGVKREIHSQINNYDAVANDTNTTTSTEVPPHLAGVLPEHETRDINMPVHATAILPVADAAAAQNEPVSTLPHEPVAEKPVSPKPDLTPPANTISHQSY